MEYAKYPKWLSLFLTNVLIAKIRKQYLYFLFLKILYRRSKTMKKNFHAVKTSVKKSTRAHPLQNIIITFGAGLLVGGIIRRIRSR